MPLVSKVSFAWHLHGYTWIVYLRQQMVYPCLCTACMHTCSHVYVLAPLQDCEFHFTSVVPPSPYSDVAAAVAEHFLHKPYTELEDIISEPFPMYQGQRLRHGRMLTVRVSCLLLLA